MQASPSKARAQALESHSWSLVIAWLSDLYHPRPVPSFERNGTTLRALQALMTESLGAEKLQELLFEARCEQVETANDTESRLGREGKADLIEMLETSLPASAESALESLSRSAVLLGCDHEMRSGTDAASIIQTQIIELSRQIFEIETQIQDINNLISSLKDQTSYLESITAKDKSSQRQIDLDPDLVGHESDEYSILQAQTLQHQRETKQLALKADEYRERIAHLSQICATHNNDGEPTIADLAARQETVTRKRRDIAQLERQILSFAGLPPDIEASRQEVKRATGEVERLKARRDELFANLNG